MVDIWYSFAVQSNPNGGMIEKELLNGSSWLPVNQTTSVGNLKCLNINRDLAIIDLPEMKKLQVWESIYEEDVPASK